MVLYILRRAFQALAHVHVKLSVVLVGHRQHQGRPAELLAMYEYAETRFKRATEAGPDVSGIIDFEHSRNNVYEHGIGGRGSVHCTRISSEAVAHDLGTICATVYCGEKDVRPGEVQKIEGAALSGQTHVRDHGPRRRPALALTNRYNWPINAVDVQTPRWKP